MIFEICLFLVGCNLEILNMLPLIIVSKNKKDIDDFLQNFIKENKITKNRIYTISPLKKDILISQIRELKKQILIATPFLRLFVIYEFDGASLEAQNALLKSLEEDIIKNQFILMAENEYLILPTIRSRSEIVRLKSKNMPDAKIDEPYSNLLRKIELSTNYAFLADKTLANVQKSDVINFFEMLIIYYRSKLESSPISAKIIKKALLLKSLLESNNLNPQLTCDNLLIFINKAFMMKE